MVLHLTASNEWLHLQRTPTRAVNEYTVPCAYFGFVFVAYLFFICEKHHFPTGIRILTLAPKLQSFHSCPCTTLSLNLRTGKREGFYLEMKILNIKLCLSEYTWSGSKNRCTYGVLGRAQNFEFNFKEAFSFVCREAFSSITEWSMSLAVGSLGTVQARVLQWTYTLMHVELFFRELMNSAMMFVAVGHIIAAIYDYP